MDENLKKLIHAAQEVVEMIRHDAEIGWTDTSGKYAANWRHEDPDQYRITIALEKALKPYKPKF